MLRNYFNVVVRTMLKHKFFSAINVLGMTVGITSSLLILLYIQDELSFDRFHQNADRIYQVGLHGKIGAQDIRTANTCPPLGPAMGAEIPEVESTLRVLPYYGQIVVKVNEKSFIEDKLFFVDSNFFNFFSFVMLEGDQRSALVEPNTVVITRKMAKKYFGDESPVGKLMVIGLEKTAYKVTGIAEDPPSNSHFRFAFLLSAASSQELKSSQWMANGMYTYFMLKPHTSVRGVEVKLEGLVVKYAGPELEKFMGITLAQFKQKGDIFGYFVTAMPDIHLDATTRDTLEPGGNVLYVYSFGIIAGFIILIACINFMNMSTAKSAGRAKEVGLRKTLGSLREQMIGQFLTESLFYSLLAMVLAVMATYLLLPGFNVLSGKELGISALLQGKFVAGIALVVIFVGLAAGSYPAFYLTSFKVVEVLKGKARAGVKSQGVRSAMVIFQFGISIFLIIATAIVSEQLRFMQNRDMGFDKKNVLYIYNLDRLEKNRAAFRNTLASRGDVSAVSFTTNSFPGVNNTTVFKAKGDEHDHMMGLFRADYDMMNVMKFTMVQGRYFSRDYPSDSTAIILNETAAKEFGWKDAVNEEILFSGDGRALKNLHVIGVYKDFNFESLRTSVRPLAIMLVPGSDLLSVRYTGNSKDIIAGVEREWKKYAPDSPLQYRFLDENFDSLFRSEQRLSRIIMIFSGLAIFIANLGLFALSAFTAEQRTKEIGIRKALGATVSGLAIMMTKEFIMLVLIAFGVFCLPAWWLTDWWLKGFAYRVPVNPMVFVAAGLAAVAVAWITVSFQSFKAAATDPVKSLRYE